MSKVIINEATTKNPISLIGELSGICYGSDTSDPKKNYKRGLNCIKDNHGRTLEYPQIYMVIDDYSARVVREIYTHIGGAPTRTQESTRFINYGEFEYIVPPAIEKSEHAMYVYTKCMNHISESIKELEKLGIKKEDSANLLPLGMETGVVERTNLRNIIDMSRQRMCSRAYWEYRRFMRDLIVALSEYSEEWEYLIDELNVFHAKCDELGYCPESHGCGRYPKKED